tara:strand:+ start:3746 stop:4567 length:822 start_codon:yes stop_codon:yes gene_type:complete
MGDYLTTASYNNFKDIPYLNGGQSKSSEYITDLSKLKNIKDLSINSDYNTELINYYYNGSGSGDAYDSTDNLSDLHKMVGESLVENEKYIKDEYSNRLNHVIKVENLYKNFENIEKYNNVLHGMAEEDISLDTMKIEEIQNDLENKSRSLEIRKYYDDKMKAQTSIIKIVIVISLILLAISFFYKINILNTNIYIVLIGIGLAFIVIFTIGKLFDILIRDNYNFDEYAFIRSHYYLNKGGGSIKTEDASDIPLHKQNDLISNKCLSAYNDSIA